MNPIRRIGRLVPPLPTPAWALLGADTFAAVGTGLTLPYLMVYLHSVRGLALGVAGGAAALVGFAGLLGNPLGGTLTDRFGPRLPIVLGWFIAGLGACAIAFVSSPWQAFGAAALSGFGGWLAWPALDTLMARVVTARMRSGAFALRHTVINIGFALGGLVASEIADVSQPSSFIVLYILDAASFALAVPFLFLIRTPAFAVPVVTPALPVTRSIPIFRNVLRDRLFLRVWLMIVLLVAVGFAQLNSTLPLYVVSSGLGTGVVGLAFAVNTVVVTACQLPMLRLWRSRRRTSAMMALGLIWTTSWALILAGREFVGELGSAAFIFAAVSFGLGETLFVLAVPAIVNDISPDALRGSYNGSAGFAYNVGFIVGPAGAGLVLERGLYSLLALMLMAACILGVVVVASIRRKLPANLDIIDPPGDFCPSTDTSRTCHSS
ncbi:MFS transporter [Streptomyces sp. NPDC001286]